MKLFYSMMMLLFCLNMATAQSRTESKEDVIIKTNGEELKGKITKIDDQSLQFVYTGESLEYSFKKSDIVRIVHSSGRVETFSQSNQTNQTNQSPSKSSPADHHNKIAILPFGFLMDQQQGSQEIGYKAQDDTYSFLSKHSAGYTVQDTRTTNSLLLKNNITRDKMRGFSMKELCDILGVEYLIDGTVTQTKGAMTTNSSGYNNTNVKRDDAEKIKNVSSYDGNNSYTQQRYEIGVSISIYTDTDSNIFNQSHKAFLTTTDGSYNAPLEYLLKRSPLYRK